MNINLSISVDMLDELEHIPQNQWTEPDCLRLEAFAVKVRNIVNKNKKEHEDWVERYGIKRDKQPIQEDKIKS